MVASQPHLGMKMPHQQFRRPYKQLHNTQDGRSLLQAGTHYPQPRRLSFLVEKPTQIMSSDISTAVTARVLAIRVLINHGTRRANLFRPGINAKKAIPFQPNQSENKLTITRPSNLKKLHSIFVQICRHHQGTLACQKSTLVRNDILLLPTSQQDYHLQCLRQ